MNSEPCALCSALSKERASRKSVEPQANYDSSSNIVGAIVQMAISWIFLFHILRFRIGSRGNESTKRASLSLFRRNVHHPSPVFFRSKEPQFRFRVTTCRETVVGCILCFPSAKAIFYSSTEERTKRRGLLEDQ